MTTTIAIIKEKGGDAKTTTAVNLAATLANLFSKKVCLIDFDPSCSATNYFKLNVKDALTSHDLISRDHTHLTDLLLHSHGIDIMPSEKDLAINLNNPDTCPTQLRDKISLFSAFDFVIIDCGPTLSLLPVNAACAADYVLTTCVPESDSYEMLDDTLRMIETVRLGFNSKLKILGILTTMVDKRLSIHKAMIKMLGDSKRYKDLVFKTMIRRNVHLSEARSFSQDIHTYKPLSHGSEDYIAFTHELLKRLESD